MKKLLFIGDSFTAGENNNFISYAQYLDKSYDSTPIGISVQQLVNIHYI
jgi:hypothetical protein